ncbi:MAG: NAD(P)H-binding protein [Deltaproteobacteria bacterium]|nr:NAD(P)H-binding protein [Deltaproteobacteria bacterium]
MKEAGNRGGQVAFVAGATGYTGREVVRILCETGYRTIAHVRPDSCQFREWEARFEMMGAEVDGTAWEEQAMARALGRLGPSAVFALLGTTRARAKDEGRSTVEGYEAVDYGLTAMLRRAAEASGHAPRFVYLSSLGVTPNARNPYLAVRARIEGELRKGSLPYTVVRPAFITGADRDEERRGERIGAVALDGVAGVLGAIGAKRLGKRLATTTNTALAQELVRLAFESAAAGQIIESEDLEKGA